MGSLDEAVKRDVVTYSQQSISDVGTLVDAEAPSSGDNLDVLTGADKPLVVRVYGQNLDVLRPEANNVRRYRWRGRRRPRPAVSSACPRSRSSAIETDLARAERLWNQAGRRPPGGGHVVAGYHRSATSSASRRCSRSS